MKRALIVATTASMIDQFNRNNIDILLKMGYEVHIACNFKDGNTTSSKQIKNFREEMLQNKIMIFDFPIRRSPFAYGKNLWSCFLLKKIIERYKYKLIHCHTPMGGVVARIAAMGIDKWGGKIIYTAHGFHFYKGCPWQNKLIYKNVERIMARCTDKIITINQEDYQAATLFPIKNNGVVCKIPGVGIKVEHIKNLNVDIAKKRIELEVKNEQTLILSVGELNENKNHEVVIKAIAKLRDENILYCICGQGGLKKKLQRLVKELNIEQQIKFLGYRRDVIEIMKAADIFVHPSFREGLSVAMMQAIAVGLPVICSKIRGNVDLIKENVNGFLVAPRDINGFSERIYELIRHEEIADLFKRNNLEEANKFDCKNIEIKLKQIYDDF